MEPQELTDYRKSLNLNKEQMGLHLGVSGAAIGLWEKGTNRIPLTIQLFICLEKENYRLRELGSQPPKTQVIYEAGDKANVPIFLLLKNFLLTVAEPRAKARGKHRSVNPDGL